MVPSKELYSIGWSSTSTASLLTDGSRLGPFGTAQLFITPSSSRRKSKWSRLAACFWITNRSRPGRVGGGAFSPDGSAVRLKSRFRLYSASCVRASRFSPPLVVVAIGCLPYAVFFLALGLRLAATDFALARTAPFLPAPSSRLARRRDIRSRTSLSGASPSGSSSLTFLPFILALMTFIRLA